MKKVILYIITAIHLFLFLVLITCIIVSFFSKINRDTVFIFGQTKMPSCKYYKITGKQCGSCGLTRSWISISKLNFKLGNQYNKSGIPTYFAALTFLIGSILFFFLRKSLNSNQRIVVYFTLFTILIIGWHNIIIVNYQLNTYKMINSVR
jgi:hypothetical protein